MKGFTFVLFTVCVVAAVCAYPSPPSEENDSHFDVEVPVSFHRLRRSPSPQHGFGHHGVLRGNSGGNERGVNRNGAYPGYSYNHHGGNAFNRGQQG
ncbi:hypothetical protein Ocin01_08748 [Orchesella cincta]|uniref:Uncharacterized protein n=1 Tax=Orchesella cincta TaxID=48709 RepID=A0A1D2MY52_ORCCI|nr:hypothetical protein Ocin01_08748 [Orchesella cincta]